ncbi:hypothetical protein J1777_06475 [Comamonas denitrificans]|uniref:Uncharacterized protein n=1 Tax=Comamonas denitrificans TaxID=117506 RepID=A0A939GV08_9BURK|nr:major capsid protein [Comamonas denitrificans]MBO1249477.1 hypothetical protein [Comamonas denitrificans]
MMMFDSVKNAVITAAQNTKTLGLSVGTGLMVYGGKAFAAPPTAPDVADGVAFIESLLVPIGLLGAAFLIVGIAIKGWKIMRSV